MKTIQCICGKSIQIDDENLAVLDKYRWSCLGFKTTIRTKLNSRSGVVSLKITDLILNPPPGFIADHKDRDIHNCLTSNLRLATKQQNNCNCGIRKDNTSGFKGVHYRNDNGQWRAKISVNGKRILLGQYPTAEEAARAYNAAATLYHGEFAYINPI